MKKTAKWIVTALAASLALLVMGCENDSDSVAVESVRVYPSTVMLVVGDTGYLSAMVMPLDAEDEVVTWESSDPDVVTVSEYTGNVTAVGEGTAIITAKAGGKQGTCEVTVHVHSYSEGKCTVCGAELKIENYWIGDEGVLKRYYGDEATVVISEDVTGIKQGAFYDNKNIESVTIPGSVKSIEDSDSWRFGAFTDCTNLKTVTMCEGVESIGSYAFYNCTSLTSVTIPASVTSIGSYAFNGGTNLTEIQFEGTKEQWNAIEGSDKVGIPGIRCSDGHIGVLGVPAYLIVSGTEVTGYKGTVPANVVIPEGITGIKQGAFHDNKNIESVTIPGSVKSIEDRGDGYSKHGAFESCTNLKTVTMCEGVESIGDYAFYGTGLKSVTIPASVTSIGYNAFFGCTTVTYKGTLAQWCAMDKVFFLMSNAKTVTLDGIDLKTVTELTIPDGVESIGKDTFYNCTNLASVTIPASVTSIGWYAFYGCESLTEIEIPGSVKSIGNSAFSWCKSLATVTINDGVESIGSNAFSGCTSLTEIEIPGSVKSIEDSDSWRFGAFEDCTNLKTVTMCEGVESIGDYAFYNCKSLASVTIPASVTEIGSDVFYSCYSLKTVNYGGTEEQWKAITKDLSYGLSGKTITGKDGSTWKAQ